MSGMEAGNHRQGLGGTPAIAASPHGCDWLRKQDGGKSLIKQIISCWGREQLHFSSFPPPPSLGRLLNFHALASSLFSPSWSGVPRAADRPSIYLFFYFLPIGKRPFHGSSYAQWCIKIWLIFLFFNFCRVKVVFEGVRWRLGLRLGFVKKQLDKSSRYRESRCHPFTCQDVPACGGPLLHLHPPHTHEVLLLVRLKLVFSNCFEKLKNNNNNNEIQFSKIHCL